MKTDINAPTDRPHIDVAMHFDPEFAVSALRRPANVGAISGEAAKRFREQKVAFNDGGESGPIE